MQKWERKHGFTVPASRLLAETLQGRLHKEVTFTPRKLSLMMLEHMVRINMANAKNVQSLVTSGKDVQTQGTEEVKSAHEIYIRISAYMSILALMSIWCPLRLRISSRWAMWSSSRTGYAAGKRYIPWILGTQGFLHQGVDPNNSIVCRVSVAARDSLADNFAQHITMAALLGVPHSLAGL